MKLTSVIVTRPSGQAEGLINALQQQGISAWHLPTVEITPRIAEQENKEIAFNLDRYDKVFCLSVNAAKQALNLLEDYWPQWPQPQTWYAVGEATADVLRDAQLEVETPKEHTSEGLLQLAALQQLSDQRCLICSGEGGRTLLGDTLSDRGAQVTKVALYRRQPIEYDQNLLHEETRSRNIDGVIVTSVEIMESLLSSFGKFSSVLTDLPLVVPSTRVKKRAKELGFKQILLADSANTTAIVAALSN